MALSFDFCKELVWAHDHFSRTLMQRNHSWSLFLSISNCSYLHVWSPRSKFQFRETSLKLSTVPKCVWHVQLDWTRTIMLNNSFWTAALGTEISKFSSSVGKHSCQKMHNLVFHILTPHSLKSIDEWKRPWSFTCTCLWTIEKATTRVHWILLGGACKVCGLSTIQFVWNILQFTSLTGFSHIHLKRVFARWTLGPALKFLPWTH